MLANAVDSSLIPIEEVARTLHTTALNVYMHIKRNLLTGHEVGEHWFVDAASLAEFLARPGDKEPTPHRRHCGGSGGGCGSCR